MDLKNIAENLKVPQCPFWNVALFVQYEKNNILNILSYSIPIKSLPDGTNVLCSFVDPIIKKGGCSDACKIVARHYSNGGSQI